MEGDRTISNTVLGVEAADEAEPVQSELDAEREKHRRRAERFGAEYQDPATKRPELRMQARKERFKKDGFVTGMDLFSEEEIERRRERAERWQTQDVLQITPLLPDEEELKRKERAARFGVAYEAPDTTGLKDADVLEEKKDVSGAVQRRPEAVHLYGVDVMSTSDCLGYFGEYGPTYVEWINDSSCNVLFDDKYTAKRAIVGLGKPLPPNVDAPDGAGLDPADPVNIQYLWHKGADFEKSGAKIPLLFRLATVEDTKPSSGKHTTRRLWVKGGQQRQGQQRGRQNGEDVEMSTRGERGGERLRRKNNNKRQRDMDVDMAEAEEYEDDGFRAGAVPDYLSTRHEHDDRTQPAQDDGFDWQQMQQHSRAFVEEVHGTFSAAAAGITIPLRKKAPRLAPARQRVAAPAAEAAGNGFVDGVEQRTMVAYDDL